MKIVIVDTYYPAFLAALYRQDEPSSRASYDDLHASLIDACFGTSNYYSRYLNDMGHPTEDLVVNAKPMQIAWAKEHGVEFSRVAIYAHPRAFGLPFIGPWLKSRRSLTDIAIAQIEEIKPDVVYCQTLSFFSPDDILRLRKTAKLIVGQNASPLPSEEKLKSFDLILTSFPHVVPRLRAMGIGSEYFRLGFDTKPMFVIGAVERDIDASFVGGISPQHGKATALLEYLARQTPLEFFGYGARELSRASAVRHKHHGEAWGLDMYRVLARSRITLNRHIDVAENNANNMRLYEATGMGAMLVTDLKDNLHELFQIGKEVVAYSSPQEAVDMIRYYYAHEEEAADIARAGRDRTLRDHTYQARMRELVPILTQYLEA